MTCVRDKKEPKEKMEARSEKNQIARRAHGGAAGDEGIRARVRVYTQHAYARSISLLLPRGGEKAAMISVLLAPTVRHLSLSLPLITPAALSLRIIRVGLSLSLSLSRSLSRRAGYVKVVSLSRYTGAGVARLLSLRFGG